MFPTNGRRWLSVLGILREVLGGIAVNGEADSMVVIKDDCVAVVERKRGGVRAAFRISGRLGTSALYDALGPFGASLGHR